MIFFARSSCRPRRSADLLADLVAAGRLDLAPVEDLQRQVAPDRLRLDQVLDRRRAVLVVGDEGQLVLALGQIDGHALEIEALLDLAADLVERVAQLLLVEVADDVERHVSCHGRSILSPSAGVGPAGRRSGPLAAPGAVGWHVGPSRRGRSAAKVKYAVTRPTRAVSRRPHHVRAVSARPAPRAAARRSGSSARRPSRARRRPAGPRRRASGRSPRHCPAPRRRSPGRRAATASASPSAEAIVVSGSRPAQMSAIATASASARTSAKSSRSAAVRWNVSGS